MIDTWSLFLGLLFGSIGFGYYLYGRKQANTIVRYSGIALMVYPYFVDNHYALVAVGLGLMVLPKFVDL